MTLAPQTHHRNAHPERHAARVGASILSHIGLGDLIAETGKDYVQNAIELASNLERLQELRSQMRHRIRSSTLTDAEGFAHDMQSVYRQIWCEWCRQKT